MLTKTLAILAIALGFVAIAFTAIANADALDTPAQSVSRIEALWRSGAFGAAIILTTFYALGVLRTRVAWLQTGYRAVWASALMSGLGFLAEGILSGATPNLSMMLVAVLMTLALAQQPTPKEPR